MPESTRDRCMKAHECLFLLSKSQRYFYDQDAIKEPVAAIPIARIAQNAGDQVEGKVRSRRDSFKQEDSKREQATPRTHRPDRHDRDYPLDVRDKCSVWSVPTVGYKGAHPARPDQALHLGRCAARRRGAGPNRRRRYHVAGFNAGRSPANNLRAESGICRIG